MKDPRNICARSLGFNHCPAPHVVTGIYLYLNLYTLYVQPLQPYVTKLTGGGVTFSWRRTAHNALASLYLALRPATS